MRDMTKFFLADTYALLAIIDGEPNYKSYTNYILVTTKFNLAELFYQLLKDYGEDIADKYFKKYSDYLVFITPDSIKNGMRFKLKYKKEKLSYVDCVGYARALELDVRFLTGDEKFENRDNVEFVR